MGVDILWFMPINPIGVKNRKGTLGSYYSVKDYLGVNPEFGTIDDFKSLVNEIHKMGMHVIIDWVANHTAWDNNLAIEHPDWYTKDSLGNFVPPVPDWHDVIDLNYANNELRHYMINALKFWVKECDIDGYRCDVASMVPTDFWIEARKELDKIKPVFMLAESDDPALHQAFDMTYDWRVYSTLNDIASGKKNLDSLKIIFKNDQNNFPKDAIRMQFTTNHDENSWHGTAIKRLGAAFKSFTAFTFVIPGMPLIYSGQEAGINKSLDFFEKDTINWSNFKYEKFYHKLIDLKKNNKALQCEARGGGMEVLKYNTEDETSTKKVVFPFIREKDGDEVFAVFNFSDKEQKVIIQSSKINGEYKNLITGDRTEYNNFADFVLKSWGYEIYVK
jgi:glycosidase